MLITRPGPRYTCPFGCGFVTDSHTQWMLHHCLGSKFSNAIEATIDRQIELERKAAAWDELVARASSCDVDADVVLAMDMDLVHPAQEPSKR